MRTELPELNGEKTLCFCDRPWNVRADLHFENGVFPDSCMIHLEHNINDAVGSKLWWDLGGRDVFRAFANASNSTDSSIAKEALQKPPFKPIWDYVFVSESEQKVFSDGELLAYPFLTESYTLMALLSYCETFGAAASHHKPNAQPIRTSNLVESANARDKVRPPPPLVPPPTLSLPSPAPTFPHPPCVPLLPLPPPPQMGSQKLRYQGPLQFLFGKALQLSADLEGIRASLSPRASPLIPDVHAVFEQENAEVGNFTVVFSGVGGLRLVKRFDQRHTTCVNILLRTCDGGFGNCLRVALNKTPCKHLLTADKQAGATLTVAYVSANYPPYLLTEKVLAILTPMSFTPPNINDVPASSLLSLGLPMNLPLKKARGRQKKNCRRHSSRGELRSPPKKSKHNTGNTTNASPGMTSV
jgi:hypothetical protein